MPAGTPTRPKLKLVENTSKSRNFASNGATKVQYCAWSFGRLSLLDGFAAYSDQFDVGGFAASQSLTKGGREVLRYASFVGLGVDAPIAVLMEGEREGPLAEIYIRTG